MRRDMDLVRSILMDVEQAEGPVNYTAFARNGVTDDMALYHVRIMEQAGLVDCEFSNTYAGADADVLGLTWDGQEFLAAVKRESVWSKVKETVAVKGGAATFDIIKALAVKGLTAMFF